MEDQLKYLNGLALMEFKSETDMEQMMPAVDEDTEEYLEEDLDNIGYLDPAASSNLRQTYSLGGECTSSGVSSPDLSSNYSCMSAKSRKRNRNGEILDTAQKVGLSITSLIEKQEK